ncbi:Zn-ribbon domain-containing OB-fold protein [Noviherbaspirillum galbum]|uniref:OB-fold domain-containing protein n=1 Tax=Noviherbaspirillum galbum TaxID=2709383 RepID=A0A6B3SY95_9BURK|nr:OB-fold domain-containing protein [Noviherbaspirillum galbum]NEX64685.1 OB-fold domain-containing protein [Noviherbaspirillum galbum]
MKISKWMGPHFRETPRGMVLVATQLAGAPAQFPPVEFLHGDQRPAEVELGPSGHLYSYTVVHASKDKPPYGLAMVDFEPGVRAFGRLLFDGQPPALGSRVRVVPFALQDGTPDYAFQE